MAQIALALLGILVGAGLNSLADDLPRHVAPGRPHCESCGSVHGGLQWLATLAFVVGRGQCVHCGAPLRLRRLVVEVISAVMLVFLYQRFGATLRFGLLAILLECLLLISIIDVEHRLILYATVFPAAGAAVLYSLLGAERGILKTVVGGVVGFGVVYLIYLMGWAFAALIGRLRGQQLSEAPFGGGDVNLAGVVGLAVGWSGIVLALVIAVLAGGVGAVVYLAIMTIRRRYSMFTPIPYGPYLVLGAVVLLLFDSEIRRWYGLGG